MIPAPNLHRVPVSTLSTHRVISGKLRDVKREPPANWHAPLTYDSLAAGAQLRTQREGKANSALPCKEVSTRTKTVLMGCLGHLSGVWTPSSARLHVLLHATDHLPLVVHPSLSITTQLPCEHTLYCLYCFLCTHRTAAVLLHCTHRTAALRGRPALAAQGRGECPHHTRA